MKVSNIERREHEDGWWERKQVYCPCCQTILEIEIDIRVTQVGVKEGKSEFEDKVNPKERLSPKEKKELEDLKSLGLYDAFMEILPMAKPDQPPKYPEEFFLRILFNMKERMLSAVFLNEIKKEYPGAHISFYATEGIGLIVAGTVAKRFLPTNLITASKLRPIGGNKISIPASEERFTKFIKTKFGLVAGPGAMLDMMGGKSKGAFYLPNFKTWRDR